MFPGGQISPVSRRRDTTIHCTEADGLFFDELPEQGPPTELRVPAGSALRLKLLSSELSRDGVVRRRSAPVSMPPGPFRAHQRPHLG